MTAKRLHIVCLACFALMVFALEAGAAGRFALVIGNDSYRQVESLQTARADATAMAKALEELGFKVTLRLDTDDRALKAAIRLFKGQLNGGDEAVFFYAGHGVQLGAENFLIPVDVGLADVDQIRDESVSLQRILDDMQAKKPRFSLVIVDACRNNPFRSQVRAAATRGLTPVSAATGQMVIYSAGAGQTAIDRLGSNDRDPNGLFTRVFLREMRVPGVSVDRVLRRVRDEVVAQARGVGHEQVPAIYDQAIGDFFFVPATQVAVSRPAIVEPAPVAAAAIRPEPVASTLAPAPAATAPAATPAPATPAPSAPARQNAEPVPERVAAIDSNTLRAATARAIEMRKPVYSVGDSWVMREFDLVTKVELGRISNAVREVNDTEYWMVADQGSAKFWSRGDHRRLVELERFQFDLSAPGQRGRLVHRVRQPDVVPWPIQVSDSWRQKVAFVFPGGESGHLDLSYAVEAIEQVATPAGIFESFKVTAKGYWYSDFARPFGSRGRAEMTSWYATAAKREVRSELRTWTGTSGRSLDVVLGRELLSYGLAPIAGVPAKPETVAASRPEPAAVVASTIAVSPPTLPERVAAIDHAARLPTRAQAREMRKPVYSVGDSWVMREFDLITKVESGRFSNSVREVNDDEYWMLADQAGAKFWSRGDHRTLVELERFQFEPAAPGQAAS